jgi:peroxiredoxin
VRAFKAEFDRRGVAIVIVSFAAPAKIVSFLEYHHWPFTILADPERKAYAAFALKPLSWWRVFSPAMIKLYFKLMGKGLQRRDYGKEDVYQSGGDFVLDREGNILFAHRSEDPGDRPNVGSLLMAIDRSAPAR